MDCYICGAGNAIWPISSKPTENGQPFFPFLEYHTNHDNERKVGNDGKVIACNVCYSFLIQQWNSYEDTETPLVKRLYWLKHPSDYQNQENNIFNQISCFEKDHSLSESESSSNSCITVRSSQVNFDSRKTLNTEDPTCSHMSPHSTAVKINNTSIDCLKQEASGSNWVSVQEEKSCFVCGKSQSSFFRSLHTRPQLKPETPFYPCLITLHPHLADLIDSQGRVLSCEECYQTLLYQWQIYSKNGTPVSERKYNINGDDKLFTCFLCGSFEPLPANVLCNKQLETNSPFYPFLNNLREASGADAMNKNGQIKACCKCSKMLSEQWNAYKKAGTPDDRCVYSIFNKNPMHLDVIVIPPAPIANDAEILCLICNSKQLRKDMEEIYSNPYSNMDLSFLEQIEKVNGTYFSRKFGQSLACQNCFESLSHQWKKFEAENVPLHLREYMLHRCNDYETKHQNQLINCELCTIGLSFVDSSSIYVTPRKDRNLPFFPFLAKVLENRQQERINLQVCKFCYSNLISQWNYFETLSKADNDRYRRRYRPFHFVCYKCGETVHKSGMRTIDKKSLHRLSKSVRSKPQFAIEVGDLVMICIPCNDVIDAECKTGQSEKKDESLQRKIKLEKDDEDDYDDSGRDDIVD